MMLQFRRYLHVPVLLGEVLQALKVRAGGRYIDGTVGEGGHASAILEHSSPGGRLLCIDADPEALEAARARLRPYGQAATLVNDNFRNLKAICHQLDFHPVDGIMFDLGLSSLQLGASDRGFSFQTDAPLDMRFNPSQETTAATIVNTYPEQELAHIIESYGEDHRSRQIARAIIARRPINTTLQLAAVVERVVGSRRRIHPATRTFQALRIAVNRELESLEAALEQSPALLAAGGRLAVISYHSLEDRIVKDYLRRESRDCLCPPQTPACICGHKATLKIVTKKPTVPSSDEIRHNPRSRSAKMRVAERI